MQKFVVVPFIFLLIGCNAKGGIGVEGSPAWRMRYDTAEKRKEYYTEICEEYGYQRDSKDMIDCIAAENRANR